MWRTLIASSAGQVRGGCLDVDLADVALRAGLGDVGDDLVLELLVDDVAGDDRAVLLEVDAVVLRAWSGRRRRRVSGAISVDAADPEDPVLALDDGGRRVDLGGEDAPQERLVGLACRRAATQPRSPACGAVDASVETVLATSSQALPPWRSLSAASALALAAAFWAAVGSMAPASVGGLDLDDPGVARLRGGRLLDEPGVDVGGRRR